MKTSGGFVTELTDTQKRNLEYLRNLDQIIIPRDFTYWCHNTQFMPEGEQSSFIQRRCWKEIPTHSFVISREMSFVSKLQRLDNALDYGTLPSNAYTPVKGSFPFQIRILQPKMSKLIELYKDGEFQTRQKWWMGLGDGRHPKLPGKSEVHIFGSTQEDEHGQKIDIIYGVLAQDINLVTELIKLEKESGKKLQADNNIEIKNNRAHESDDKPTVIEKDKDFTRLNNTIKDGFVVLAGYRQEYEQNKNTLKL